MGKAMSSGIPPRNPEYACWQTYWLLTELCYSSVHWTPINIWNLIGISVPFGVQIVREQHWILNERKGIYVQVLNSLKVCVWSVTTLDMSRPCPLECPVATVMLCLACQRMHFMQKWHFWGILHFVYTKFFCMGHPPSYLFLYSPSSALDIHQVLHLASTKLCSLLYSQVVYFTFTKLWAWHPPSLNIGKQLPLEPSQAAPWHY
jgi:hypothetical protein